ncbi:hypothetical protein IFM89_027069 [Coptis chinensis]|uniref:shikimate kinase n=1 Tax=Coptis chinensis TaxID=261450 RepID=A0A835LXF4_9MAGN|nr:hypothetical protein IFM89_027069 [Coptis chinensis]
MEIAAGATTSLHYCTSSSIGIEKISGKTNGGGFFKFSEKRCNEKKKNNSFVVLNSGKRWRGAVMKTGERKFVDFELSCSYKNTQAPAVESETNYTSVDEALILKKKSQDVAPYLSGCCIYLVGMMGSGKTTVGKILSEVLGYSFLDSEFGFNEFLCNDPIMLNAVLIIINDSCAHFSDKLVEQAVGAPSVAQIFKEYSEEFFRENETKVLGDLSLMRRLVVATGGGAVIRPINWKYMKQGITVWLDVPLEALARRIAAVGTASRPLLHNEPGDAYTKALVRLSVLSEERDVVSKVGLRDVNDLTPTAIAVEVLISPFLFLSHVRFN